MWTYHPELLATPVPRYTSFPTAAEFGDSVGEADLVRALESATGDVSLYVHIPFCEKICWYCGCNTSTANRHERLASYLDSLHQETALVGARLPDGARIARVSFGGGSPNAISPLDFVRLLDTLALRLPMAQEVVWSIELDPRSLPETWGLTLRMAGVQRASLGVQTFDPAIQAAIGRVQPDADIARACDLLRGAGIASLNFDLMYGLPGQTPEILEATLARTVELGADRIALFGYAHVPHLIARQKRIDATNLPGPEQRFAMAALGHDFLVGAGYRPVGFDHFARPTDPLALAAQAGQLRRNFQGFTDDLADHIVGLGATAIGSYPDLLVQNEKNAGRYRMIVSQAHLPAALGIRRTASDRKRSAAIEGLLCHGSASIGDALMREVRPRLEAFRRLGLVHVDGERLVLAEDALPYARSVAALFDPYRQASATRFSSAV